MTYAQEPGPGGTLPGTGNEEPRRRPFGCAFEILETLILTVVIYLLIHNFVAQPFQVQQESMFPTLLEDEYVLIDKLTPRFTDYRRGDIVVFTPPEGYEQNGVPFIKRVIGIPGDVVTLNNGRVFVAPAGGQPRQLEERYIRDMGGSPVPTQPSDVQGTAEWTVPEGTFFVMGDNRNASQDSRVFGPISRDLIVGRAWIRYFPINRVGFLDTPTYAELEATAGSPYAEPLPAVLLGCVVAASSRTQRSISLRYSTRG